MAERTSFEDAQALADQLIQSAISHLQEPIKTPIFSGVNMGPLNRENTRLRDSRDTTQDVINTESARYAGGAADQKAGYDAQATAAGDKFRAEQERAQTEADRYVQWFNILGIDPSKEIGQRLGQLVPLKADADAALERVRQMQSVGFLDNPLEWIFNQVQIPPAIRDYNRRADKINSEFEFIQQGVARTKEAAELDSKGIPTITTKMAQADADKALATAKIQKGIVDREMATINVDFATKKFAENLAVANITKETTALQLQSAEATYRSQIQAIQLAENRVQRELRAAELIERVANTNALDQVLQNYDRVMGNSVGTTSRAMFQRLPEQMRNNIAAISSGSYGTNLLQFYETVTSVRPGPNFSPETRKLYEWTAEKIATIAGTSEIRQISDKAQQKVKIGQVLDQLVDLEIKNPSASKIFKELTPQHMLQSGVVAEDSILGQAFKAIKNEGSIPTPLVVSTISSLYKNPVDSGAAIATYYTQNIGIRNEVLNAKAAGLKLDISYRVPLSMGFGGTIMLDLTKPAEATKYVLIQQQKEAINRQIGNPGANPFRF